MESVPDVQWHKACTILYIQQHAVKFMKQKERQKIMLCDTYYVHSSFSFSCLLTAIFQLSEPGKSCMPTIKPMIKQACTNIKKHTWWSFGFLLPPPPLPLSQPIMLKFFPMPILLNHLASGFQLFTCTKSKGGENIYKTVHVLHKNTCTSTKANKAPYTIIDLRARDAGQNFLD